MKNLKLLTIPFVVLAFVVGVFFFLQCDMGVNGDNDDNDDNGGAGADFDETLYYTKSDVDQLIADATESAYAIAGGSDISVQDSNWDDPETSQDSAH